jgi:hypothetical protein
MREIKLGVVIPRGKDHTLQVPHSWASSLERNDGPDLVLPAVEQVCSECISLGSCKPNYTTPYFDSIRNPSENNPEVEITGARIWQGPCRLKEVKFVKIMK